MCIQVMGHVQADSTCGHSVPDCNAEVENGTDLEPPTEEQSTNSVEEEADVRVQEGKGGKGRTETE
jgi:hypothetical protein